MFGQACGDRMLWNKGICQIRFSLAKSAWRISMGNQNLIGRISNCACPEGVSSGKPEAPMRWKGAEQLRQKNDCRSKSEAGLATRARSSMWWAAIHDSRLRWCDIGGMARWEGMDFPNFFKVRRQHAEVQDHPAMAKKDIASFAWVIRPRWPVQEEHFVQILG